MPPIRRFLPVRNVFSKQQKRRTSWTEDKSLESLHAQWVSKHNSELYRINSRLGDDLVINFDVTPPRVTFRRNLNLSAGIATPNVYFFNTVLDNDGHSVVGIYFPSERVLDIVTTYPIPEEHKKAITDVFSVEMEDEIKSIDTAKFISDVYPEDINLQFNDTDTCGPDGGWCLALTMIMVDWLDAHPDFWTLKQDDRIPMYHKMYLDMINLVKSKTGVRDAWNKIRTGSGRRRTSKHLPSASAKHRRTRRVKH